MIGACDSDRLALDSRFECPILAWTPPGFLLDLTAQDQGLLAEILEAFTTDTGARIRHLRAALSCADIAGIRRSAHSVKGAASQLGAEAVVAICQEIEIEVAETPTPLLYECVARLENAFDETCRAMDLCLRGPRDTLAPFK